MATCTNQEIHLNDIGTSFEVTLSDCGIVMDISTAIQKEFIFKSPSGIIKTVVPTFKTDGTDGILVYNTIPGDLDEEGTWKFQVKISLPNGSWSSNIDKFKVYENLA